MLIQIKSSRSSLPIRAVYHLLLLTLLICLAALARADSDWQWSGIPRVVAVSDIHGAHSGLVKILRKTSVIGDDLHWTGGDTHLVIVGDILDRGPDSRASMDLLMALEPEASRAGGQVHVLLGNHEVMNLVGDLRYVAEAEYAAFIEDESAEMRDTAFESWLTRQNPELLLEDPRALFDGQFSPGFFAHRAAFAADGKYGSWLLQQPVIAIINDTAFVHAGLSRDIVSRTGSILNQELARDLRSYVYAMAALTRAGLLAPEVNFYDHPEVLVRVLETETEADGITPELQTAARQLIELNDGWLHSMGGPVWYRGNVACSPLIEMDKLTEALAAIGGERLVVGHTPAPNAHVLSYLGERLYRIDTGMFTEFYGGRAAALVLENGSVRAAYEDREELSTPQPQPRHVGSRTDDLDAAQIEELLIDAPILKSSIAADGSTILRVGREGIEISGRFVPGKKNFVPEVAAYRLDRLLDLRMVPVTVIREHKRKNGSLQFIPDGAMTETQRSSLGGGGSAWCPLTEQFEAMYVFDTLIYNEGRGFDAMLYGRDNWNSWQLILTSHGKAFSTRDGAPPHLRALSLQPGNTWQQRLATLDQASLEKVFKGVLDSRRIKALLKRRDQMLATGK
jgi:hypothetical protein